MLGRALHDGAATGILLEVHALVGAAVAHRDVALKHREVILGGCGRSAAAAARQWLGSYVLHCSLLFCLSSTFTVAKGQKGAAGGHASKLAEDQDVNMFPRKRARHA